MLCMVVNYTCYFHVVYGGELYLLFSCCVWWWIIHVVFMLCMVVNCTCCCKYQLLWTCTLVCNQSFYIHFMSPLLKFSQRDKKVSYHNYLAYNYWNRAFVQELEVSGKTHSFKSQLFDILLNCKVAYRIQ